METYNFGKAYWWRVSEAFIDVKLSYSFSREKYDQLIRRLNEDILSIKWVPGDKYWVLPVGALPALIAFCQRYGLEIEEQHVVQSRLAF